MNVTLGTRLSDGRRVGLEWHCTRTRGRTSVQAFITHEGDLSDADLSLCLAEIGDNERIAHVAQAIHPRRRALRRRTG